MRQKFPRTLYLICSLVGLELFTAQPAAGQESPPEQRVTVEILEGIPDGQSWDFERPTPVVRYTDEAFVFHDVPRKYTDQGLVADRSDPFLLRSQCRLALPAGKYRFLLRSRGAARLFIDGKLLVETNFLTPNKSSHEKVPKVERLIEPGIHPLPIGHQERMATVQVDGRVHEYRLECFIGGKGLRAELGELAVCAAGEGEQLALIGPGKVVPFTEDGWNDYITRSSRRLQARNDANQKAAEAEEIQYWKWRHQFARDQLRNQPGPRIPEVAGRVPFNNAIDAFIGRRLQEKGVSSASLSDDDSFVRRTSIDVIGVVPTIKEIDAFYQDDALHRRSRLIDRLLDHPRWADNWVGYWQDVLAENPALLKPKLNNTGPFRWWIYQSCLDNKPMDRFVTELLMMQGSKYGGAPAGFSMATMNDVPMASKANIIAKAFLGLEMQCARCHDAPYHPFRQRQLFSLGAMLAQGPLQVPDSSSVSLDRRTRKPLVEISLKPGSAVAPHWPFADLAAADVPESILRDPDNLRARLAAILTSPNNRRFSQVIVNRLWKRYLGTGLVQPVDDWSDAKVSHPDLLEYLGREFVMHGYDLKHAARLILNSQTYQRALRPGASLEVAAENRLFAAQSRRRMTAEQIVDSLFRIVEKPFYTEELNLDPQGRRPIAQFMNLGTPRRAWQFTSLSNDRDRPALSLPFAQNVVDVLINFGWRESRQNPITVRDEAPTALQPMMLANGVVGRRVTTLSDDNAVTELCLRRQPLPDLIRAVFRQVLSRPPSDREALRLARFLGEGYAARRVHGAKSQIRSSKVPSSAVSWANHLDPEASRIKLELADLARLGDPPTRRLQSDWRERMEDVLWALVNSPEFLFVP